MARMKKLIEDEEHKKRGRREDDFKRLANRRRAHDSTKAERAADHAVTRCVQQQWGQRWAARPVPRVRARVRGRVYSFIILKIVCPEEPTSACQRGAAAAAIQ